MLEKMICGIYKITNELNGKCYIGQSIDIYTRWRSHRSKYVQQHYHNKALYRAFAKYGIDNFRFEIIERCKRTELDMREKYWIKRYDSYNNGYNMTKGGQGIRDYSHRRKYRFGYSDTYELLLKPCLADVFHNIKNILTPFAEQMDSISDCYEDDLIEELDGYDTLLNDFCDGYDNFEQWAECNLI